MEASLAESKIAATIIGGFLRYFESGSVHIQCLQLVVIVLFIKVCWELSNFAGTFISDNLRLGFFASYGF